MIAVLVCSPKGNSLSYQFSHAVVVKYVVIIEGTLEIYQSHL